MTRAGPRSRASSARPPRERHDFDAVQSNGPRRFGIPPADGVRDPGPRASRPFTIRPTASSRAGASEGMETFVWLLFLLAAATAIRFAASTALRRAAGQRSDGNSRRGRNDPRRLKRQDVIVNESEIRVVGMPRSGNHAIIESLLAQMTGPPAS